MFWGLLQTIGKLFHSNYHLLVQQNMLSSKISSPTTWLKCDSCKPHNEQLEIWDNQSGRYILKSEPRHKLQLQIRTSPHKRTLFILTHTFGFLPNTFPSAYQNHFNLNRSLEKIWIWRVLAPGCYFVLGCREILDSVHESFQTRSTLSKSQSSFLCLNHWIICGLFHHWEIDQTNL